MLYVIRTFGRTHFFPTADARQVFIDTLPEWELKFADIYEKLIGGEKA